MPPDFNVDPYLDKDAQFEAAYIKPLNIILHAIGWNHEKVSTLEGFFE